MDFLKYIDLADGAAWLTLGGEFRHRYEYFNNDAWGAIAPDDDNGYHLLRGMLFADFHIGRNLRLFTEPSSTVEEGKSTPPKPTERDELDLHQAFIEGTLRPADALDKILLRAGRQELNYGSSRLITFRDGPNTRLAFDAALIRAVEGDWTVDAFYGRPVETEALAAGYEVYFITDACGGTSKEAHDMTVQRLIQAGAVPITSLQFLLELQRDWARMETYGDVIATVKEHCGAYGVGVEYAATMIHKLPQSALNPQLVEAKATH